MSNILTPQLRVTHTLGEGGTFEVQTDNRDAVKWDMVRARKQWPPVSAAPFLYLTVVAYTASKTAGLIPAEVTLDEWLGACTQVVNITEEGEEVGLDDDSQFADPTPPTPE